MGPAFIQRAIFIFLLALLPCLESAAQAPIDPGAGTIAGTVVGPAGAAIAGARITIIEDSTGWDYSTATDCAGFYHRSGLRAGIHHLRVEAPGFRTEPISSVPVSLSQVTQLKSRLQASVTYGGPQIMVEGKTQPTGEIHGAVTDTGGAIVPARITVIGETSRGHYETTTDSQGVYRLANLPEGKYWLRFSAAGFDSGSGQEVIVKPSGGTCSDVRMPANDKETVEVCTASCVIYADPVPPAHPGIELQLYAPSNVVTASSELWLTVRLTNTSTYPIFIPTEKSSGAAFGYQIYAFGYCNCPGLLRRRGSGADSGTSKQPAMNGSSEPIHRILPGETLTEKVNMGTLTDLGGPATYTIMVERPDISSEMFCCEEFKDPALIRSNHITVTVMAAR